MVSSNGGINTNFQLTNVGGNFFNFFNALPIYDRGELDKGYLVIIRIPTTSGSNFGHYINIGRDENKNLIIVDRQEFAYKNFENNKKIHIGEKDINHYLSKAAPSIGQITHVELLIINNKNTYNLYNTKHREVIWVKILKDTNGLNISVEVIVIKKHDKDNYITDVSEIVVRFSMTIQEFNQQLVDEGGEYVGEMDTFLGFKFDDLFMDPAEALTDEEMV